MIDRLLLCAAITSLTAGLRLRCFFERCFNEATADAQTVTLNCRVTLLLFSTNGRHSIGPWYSAYFGNGFL